MELPRLCLRGPMHKRHPKSDASDLVMCVRRGYEFGGCGHRTSTSGHSMAVVSEYQGGLAYHVKDVRNCLFQWIMRAWLSNN